MSKTILLLFGKPATTRRGKPLAKLVVQSGLAPLRRELSCHERLTLGKAPFGPILERSEVMGGKVSRSELLELRATFQTDDKGSCD